jgi:hypothetical protein
LVWLVVYADIVDTMKHIYAFILLSGGNI